ncbi:MAG: cofactor-independent phosphoglycerate mutase [Actinobacteria bacterium HGW-Actinobacteria-7]|jgi:2,3-bisphosphoglycerate-independent phosphoglycerate mutase|nr:MAG: cofactor-independent phosphoglycerate mutase [Actinobacteria bacterium HGW-Actinobacteria-7]
MKYVVVILDGASGWPLAELGGKTCLQAASTPHLDALAREGQVGLAQTVPVGAEPSSAAACTSILGYDPADDYVGRGAIEAASMGIELASDEVALRLNLVTIHEGVMTSYAAGHISTEESRAIVTHMATALDDETFRLYPGVAYRHILVVKGHPELLDLVYTPPHDISDKPIAGLLPSGPGEELLLEYMDRARPLLANIAVNTCRADLGALPATDVWPFWPGVRPSGMVPFAEKRGVDATMTSGVDLLNGLAVLAGIDRLQIPGVTDGPDTDYVAQAEGALASLADHDLVVIHVESPDEMGHAGDIAGKIAAIEAIDREIVSRIRRCSEELRILAMPDHATPIEIKTHVGEPVPFILWGPGIESNGARAYDQYWAARTRLVLDPGRQVMDQLLG